MVTTIDFFERKKQELGVNLSEVQRKAVELVDGALLLLASPGSGKTTTMIMKIGYLIEEKGVDPSRIRAVTFSNASASDMDQRFDKFFPHLINNKVKFSTIHSFSFEVVRKYFKKNGIQFQLIEGEMDKEKANEIKGEGQALNKKLVIRKLFREITQENITDDQMEELLSYISFAKNKLIPTKELKEIKSDVPSAEQIYLAYEAYKNADPTKRLVDFDDMLVIANEALEEDAVMLADYQQMFDYFLTDESQDNSVVQNKIIEKLVRAKGNICVVADDDQSIYRWRGSDPDYLLNFKEVYPEATILYMEQNYRSASDIVDVANKFIKRNKNRYDKNMFTEKGSSEPIKLLHLDDYNTQISHVMNNVSKAENIKEVAILYRNNTSSITIIDELDHRGIPFYMKDSDNKFFSHWVVEDILNFMRMSYSDKHPSILEKIHSKFNGYITKSQVEYLKRLDNKESVFKNLLDTNIEIYQRKQLKMCMETFEKINGLRPDLAIKMIRKQLGYEKKLTQMCDKFGFKKEYLINILNTLEAIGANVKTLKDFADRLEHLKVTLRKSKFNKNEEALTLSTFHSSKGLEFDYVLMIDLIEGMIPSKEVIKDFKEGKIEEMEEAVRLFYVGMTRARYKLELISYREKNGERLQESTFVKNVKAIMQPYKKSGIAKPKAIKVNPDVIIKNPNAIKSAGDIAIGDKVKHVAFGIGFIEKIDEKVIGIRFESIGMKNLATSVCIDRGLLESASIADVC